MSDAGQSSTGTAPIPGNRVGAYLIEAPIGSGGVASVFRARHPQRDTVALKVLHPSRIVNDEDVRRFSREFRALTRMDHPNIVKVYEAGVSDGYPWLAMELVDGCDLGKLVDAWERDRPADRFVKIERILRGLCRGLQYIHDLGLVHRDLKPTNVLVDVAGEPKLTDFGVVKDQHANTTALTMAGRLVGTVAFMAPEQITGEHVDARADLYALGACLYMMLTFRRPIEAQSVAGYLARHLTEVPRAPGELDPSVPPKLERICQRLLLKDPAQRYASANAVLEALDRREDGASPIRGREAELAEWTRRVLTLTGGGGGVYVVLGAPGSGRSHLLRAMADVARNQGVSVVSAGGRDPMSQLLGALGEDSAGGERIERLEARLRGKPWLVCVDDLDHADPAALDAITRVIRQNVGMEGEPVLLACTAESADGPLGPLVSGASTGMPADTVTPGPLDRKAITTLLRDRGLPAPLAAVLGRRLHEEHEGAPGAIVQQLDALLAAGWLERTGDLLRPTRPIDLFRKEPLPVPGAVRAALEARLAALDAASLALCEALALLDRSASAALIAACAEDGAGGDFDAARGLDDLVREGLLRRREEADQEVLAFVHPAAAAVVRDRMSDERRRRGHSRIASALARRRRREGSLEVARHLVAAGDPDQAYPLFVQAARAAARAARLSEVFDAIGRAHALRPEVEPRLDPIKAASLRRWLFLLAGEAHLARGDWMDAIEPLEHAVAAAREEGDPAAVARASGSLGRAWYRQGRFDLARPALEAALRGIDAGAPERAAAVRALADILLREGDVHGAEKLWIEALELAEQAASRDGEARARRGLAHVRVLGNQLDAAARLLDTADELLAAGGDDRVRAGVLARRLELDVVCGHYGAALRRSETLLDLVRDKELTERLPECYALAAEARLAVGDADGAWDHARQALTNARDASAWDARLRVSRVLAALGHGHDALAALPRPEELVSSHVDDPAAQLAAVRARLIAPDDPDTARDLATWVLVRPPPLLGLRGARIAIDASLALTLARAPDNARTAAKRGLKIMQGMQADGLSLELLLAMYAAAADDRVLAAAGQVAQRIAAQLPPSLAGRFSARSDVARALAAAPKG